MMRAREVLTHCPRCGAAGFHSDDDHRHVCAQCDFVFFFNDAAACGALIQDAAGRLLLGIRARDPGQGGYDLPGGFIDFGESAEEALLREVQEELNLVVDDIRYLCSAANTYPYGGITYHTCDLFFCARVADFAPIEARDDVAAFAFERLETLDLARVAFPSTRSAITCLRDLSAAGRR